MAETQDLSELKAIREEIAFIKEHMVNIDSIMTEDDYEALQEYRKEKKAGKLSPHEQLVKELGLYIHTPLYSQLDNSQQKNI